MPYAVETEMDFRVKQDGSYRLRDFLHLYDKEFIHAAYAAILKRAPDLSGECYYLGRIRNGVNRRRILCQLLSSEEARNKGITVRGLSLPAFLDKLHELPGSGRLLSRVNAFLRTVVRGHPQLTIIQCDNRPTSLKYVSRKLHFDEYRDSESMIRSLNGKIANQADYWSLTSAVNRVKSRLIGARYVHVGTDETGCPDRGITWYKILVLRQILANAKPGELVCFLDSDAWIRDERVLSNIVEALSRNPGKHAAFSRDPKLAKNTFINTGCMVLKNTLFTRQLLAHAWHAVETAQYDNYRFDWPCEQFVLSDIVKAEHTKFYVLKVNTLNTPCGEVVRHVWWKHMLQELLDDVSRECVFKLADREYDPKEGTAPFDINDYLDDFASDRDNAFPNGAT